MQRQRDHQVTILQMDMQRQPIVAIYLKAAAGMSHTAH